MQNNTEELWNLLHFMNPNEGDFAAAKRDLFLSAYGSLTDNTQAQTLQDILRKYLLRRVKSDVERDLPRKIETVVDVELTVLQKRYYRAIVEKNVKILSGTTSRHSSKAGKTPAAKMPKLLNIAMQLRKTCNHPFLIEGVEETMEEDNKLLKKQDRLSATDRLVASSGKVRIDPNP